MDLNRRIFVEKWRKSTETPLNAKGSIKYTILKVLSSVLVYAIAFGLLKSSESDDLGYADVKVFSNLAITGKPHYL